jgi:hypothetical protein
MLIDAPPVEVIRAGLLSGIPHGFLGRRGGVSGGVCEGLNVGHGSGDDPASIDENRRLALTAVAPGSALVTVHQIHSTDVVEVTHAWPHEERPRADAMVTNRPGFALGILTADCTPVLLADREVACRRRRMPAGKAPLAACSTPPSRRWSGSAHSRAHPGRGRPTIGRRSYEVDEGFFARFVERDEDYDLFFTDGPARPLPVRPRRLRPRPPGGGRACGGSRRWGSTPMPIPRASTPTAAPPTAASPLTAASSRSSLCRELRG